MEEEQEEEKQVDEEQDEEEQEEEEQEEQEEQEQEEEEEQVTCREANHLLEELVWRVEEHRVGGDEVDHQQDLRTIAQDWGLES